MLPLKAEAFGLMHASQSMLEKKFPGLKELQVVAARDGFVDATELRRILGIMTDSNTSGAPGASDDGSSSNDESECSSDSDYA